MVTFIGHRVVRILPALAVEITLSALILGPLLTQLPLQQYFSGSEFASYFMNILGDIHYRLPGLFAYNPTHYTVNTSLWTIPYELYCYLALIVLACFGALRSPLKILMLIVPTSAIFTGMAFHTGQIADMSNGGPPGKLLVQSFLAGLLLFIVRDRIRLSWGLFIASAAITLLCLAWPVTTFFAPFPAAYTTIFLGLQRPRRIPFLLGGDYSYGLYLFAFPISTECLGDPPCMALPTCEHRLGPAAQPVLRVLFLELRGAAGAAPPQGADPAGGEGGREDFAAISTAGPQHVNHSACAAS